MIHQILGTQAQLPISRRNAQQACSIYQTNITRRMWLLSASVVLHWPPLPAVAQQQQQQVLNVGPGQAYATIAAAVVAAEPNSTVLIAPGRYEEQLQITTSVTLKAEQAGSVVICCNTQQPYRHCLEVQAGSSSSSSIDVTVQGIGFEHYSKSVANNYAIFAQAGRVQLQDCEVTSSSGAGVGAEGAAVQLRDCNIHDCERQGVAVFGSLEGGTGSCELSGCTISGNKLQGVLARDGAELQASDCTISSNGSYGLQLADCRVIALQGCVVSRNRLGAVVLELATVEADVDAWSSSNSLSGGVTLL